MAKRRCPVNALESFRLLGLEYEYLVASVAIFVLLHIFLKGPLGGMGPFVALLAAVAFGLTMQKATADKPGGWLQHVILVWVCAPERRRYFPQAAAMFEQEFQRRGVLPPASLRDTYEG